MVASLQPAQSDGVTHTLRQKLIDEIQLLGLTPLTMASYMGVVYRLTRHNHRLPDQINDDELKAYLLHLLRERKLGASTLITTVSALRLF